MARVSADLEAVRIAELYANHPLLKHMPVPRFRLPKVHLEVPVLIRGEELGSEAAQKMNAGETAGKFVDILDRVMAEHDQQLLGDEREIIRRAAALKIDEHLDLPADISGSVTGTVTDLIKVAVRTVRERLQDTQGAEVEQLLSRIREDLRRQAMTAFIRFVDSPRRLEADLSTNHVKEAGDTDVLAKIRMDVTEDGIEWATVIGRDGEPEERLVDE